MCPPLKIAQVAEWPGANEDKEPVDRQVEYVSYGTYQESYDESLCDENGICYNNDETADTSADDVIIDIRSLDVESSAAKKQPDLRNGAVLLGEYGQRGKRSDPPNAYTQLNADKRKGMRLRFILMLLCLTYNEWNT